MKKALIALAVLGAASGAAMAQSSVTLYGVADIGIGKAAADGQTKWGAESNSHVTNAVSRIGFTGKEDLGGGLWAGFKFESGLNLANGGTTGNMWGREANLQMGSDVFGTVKLGRSLTPSYNGVAAWELTGMANYSVVANTYGWGAFAQNRTNTQLDYRTPSFAGLSAELAYVPKAQGGLLDGDYGVANKTDRWDFNLIYEKGAIPGLSAAFTVNKANNVRCDPPGTAGGVCFSPDARKYNYTVGARYKFGDSFALAGSYNRSNYAFNWAGAGKNLPTPPYPEGSTTGPGGAKFGKRYGFSLGGSAYMGPFTLTLDLTRDTKNELNANRKKYTNGVLEGKYNLSKRTSLYLDYTRLDSTNNYGLGVRHNF
jgi:predicted porin